MPIRNNDGCVLTECLRSGGQHFTKFVLALLNTEFLDIQAKLTSNSSGTSLKAASAICVWTYESEADTAQIGTATRIWLFGKLMLYKYS